MGVYSTHATKLTGLVYNVWLNVGDVRVSTHAYQIALYVIPTTRVSHVWMSTGETRVLLVTLTVWTRVIKTQATARVSVVITMPTRTKVSVKHVTTNVTTNHATPLLECVIRVA